MEPSSARQRILPMSVDNMTFLVERLAGDCAPLQYMRELTMNSIQALTLCEEKGGVIVWDVDWFYFEQTGVYKLCCIDSGVGMTGDEMVAYINKLSCSIHEQGSSKNFGIGAKIAAAPLNRHGLIYRSWKNGAGAMVHLYYDAAANVYGLKRWESNRGEFWAPIGEQFKPEHIRRHGTVVTLLGNSANEDTIKARSGTPIPARWPIRYLSTRFFRLPDGITAVAREGWDLPRTSKYNFLRTIEPQDDWLSRSSQWRGIVNLGDALAHWWILKEGTETNFGHNLGGGHVAALFQDELYEVEPNRAGIARLHTFGVIFGAGRVVIYVEPLSDKVMPNTARTHLLIENNPLDWPRWASDFRDRLPDDIIGLQNEINARAGERDHREAILERLKHYPDLWNFSRFKPARAGVMAVGEGRRGRPGKRRPRPQPPDETTSPFPPQAPPPRAVRPRASDIYAPVAESEAELNPRSHMSGPLTTWISEATASRTPPELDDRAAQFHLNENRITINADFRVFTDTIERWRRVYAHVPGAARAVEDAVHEWFEQQLIETVVSAMALHRAGGLSKQEVENLWSEDSLTAAVLARYHIDQNIKRQLAQQLGSLKAT